MHDSLLGNAIFVRGSSLFERTVAAVPPLGGRAVDFVFLGRFWLRRVPLDANKLEKWVWRSYLGSVGVLTCSVLAEAFAHALFLPALKYTAASALIGLHFYNMKFCQCGNPTCTIHEV